MELSPCKTGWPARLRRAQGECQDIAVFMLEKQLGHPPSSIFFRVQKRVSRRCVSVATVSAVRLSSVPACVEELWNPSSPWLPGYKLICHVFPKKGARIYCC